MVLKRKFLISLLLLFGFKIVFIVLINASSPFSTAKTCTQTWGISCDGSGGGGIDDSYGCNGTESGGLVWVREVYLNASSFTFDSGVELTCEFREITNAREYFFYNNGTGWIEISSTMGTGNNLWINRSVSFKVDNIEDVHSVRCTIANLVITDFCADTESNYRDNDDLNFTVTKQLIYNNWDINVSDYSNLTKSDTILAYSHWNKALSAANITHDGTGNFTDYTISDFTGNWTNYTLDLSSTSEFTNFGLVTISNIKAKDTFGLENSTSPNHYFYLWRKLRLQPIVIDDTEVYNETPINIRCRVEDYHTNDSISGYDVYFYKNDTLIGQNTTNSDGWANYSTTATATQYPENYVYKCNITENPGIYYSPSQQNSSEDIVRVVEFGRIENCSDIVEPGSHYLAQDIINSSLSSCINISSNNVIFDCKGNTIDGDNTAQYGIYIDRSFDQTTNITIKNCNVSDWDESNVYLSLVNGNSLFNINSTSGKRGFYIRYSDSNIISNCTSSSNEKGFEFLTSNSNIISNSSAIDNSEVGIYLANSRNNIINYSVSKENDDYDIDFSLSGLSSCNNLIENLTGSNDLPIKFYNYSVNLNDEKLSGLILCEADNSNISDVVINASQTKDNNQLLIFNTSFSNFSNIVSSENNRGFYLYHSDNNSFSNCIANSNEIRGFLLEYSDSNYLSNCTVSNSNNYGFFVGFSNSNIFSNCNAHSCYYGFYLTASSSTTINNSVIENNAISGIYLHNTGQDGSNKIYNNLLNNTENTLFQDIIYNNIWNTTRQTGDRIYSPGTEIGGNYWTNSTGNGYSDTCNDTNYDDFCDDPYQLATNNIDYLALTSKDKFSEVSEISLNKSVIYNYTSVKAICRIIDNTTSNPIQNYNVSFYRNDTFLDWGLTNSSGYVNLNFSDTTTNCPMNYVIKCNITNEPSLGYNISESNFEDTTLRVIDLDITPLVYPTLTTYGNTVEIKANITGNASSITSVHTNISFYNRTFDTFVIKDLTLKQSFSSTNHEYNLTYSPEWPSNYSLDINVQAERVKSTSTSFETWGYSWIQESMYLSDEVVYNDSSVWTYCYVKDNLSPNYYPIQGYNVSFFRDDTYLGKNITNIIGRADYSYDITVSSIPQNLTLKCNITNQPEIFYNASLIKSKNRTIEVVDLGIKTLTNISSIVLGDSIEIIANITGNASSISSVQANISYTNFTGGQYIQTFEILDLTYKNSYSNKDHEYNLIYNPPRPSNYNVNITINAGKIKSNTTNFDVWSFSKLNQITLNKSIIYNATGIQINCTVKDNSTNNPILNQNISLYKNDEFIITKSTDSNGLASHDYFVTSENNAEDLIFKCNITDQPGLHYNTSSENSKNTTLQVFELLIDVSTPSSSDFGDSIEIIANITGNASSITGILANISYSNLVGDIIIPAFDIQNLTYKQSFSSTNHEYNLTYNPPRSGSYDVNVSVQAVEEKSNTSSFMVSFGTPTITFVFPNYRIMINQTFNFTANISSSSGDIWYTNLTIDITNETVMNVTPDQDYSISTLYNITNGSSITTEWSLKSNEIGLCGVTLNSTPQNGTSDSSFSSHSIIYPIIETTTPINVSDNENMTIKIMGNVTGISSINLSIFVPYTNDIINVTASYSGNQTEAICSGETLSSERFTIGESYGGNATCTGTDCSNTIDNVTTSFMNVGQDGFDLIIKLNSEETIERVLLLWSNFTGGTPTIYYNSSGNWVTNSILSNLSPPESKSQTTLTGFTPFRTNAFKINNTDNLVKIYEMEAYGTLGRVGLCYIYEYNFSETNRSGTYFVNSTTETENSIVVQSSSFFANFGYPSIQIEYDSIMFKGSTYEYDATITAYNGDLRNLTVNLTIANTSVVQNSSVGETFLRNISEVLNTNSETVTWNLTAIEDGTTITNVSVNSTTNKGHYNQTGNYSIEVISEAGNPPNVANFWFSYSGVKTNKTNLLTAFKVYANVSDDVKIDSAFVNLTYPGGSNVNLSMTGPLTFGWQTWEYTFENTNYPLNKTGNYTVGITVRDLGGQENVSGTYENHSAYMTFYVNNTYILELTSGNSLYMRGENVSVKAKDVNGNYVNSVNWNVNVTKINQTFTESPTQTEYSYQIQNNDPEGNYSIFANASKNGNLGTDIWNFDVYSNYSISLDTISPSSPQAPGSLLSVRFKLADARNDMPTGDRPGYVTCLNGSYLEETFYSPFLFTNDYSSTITDCYAPNQYSKSYDIYVNLSDDYNNTGDNTFSFNTRDAEVTINPGSPGGSSSGPSGPTCEPVATFEMYCNDGLDDDCDGATDCSDADCSDFPACIERIPDFNFTLSSTEVEIIRGENATIFGSMSNLGNTQLNLISKVEIEEDCCSVKLPSSFVLPVRVSSDFSMNIHVNTSTPPGEYIINLKIRYPPLENSRNIKVMVKENSYIWFVLEDTPKYLPTLLTEIEEYESLGINVDHLREKIREIENTIAEANKTVHEDNLELMKKYSDEIDEDIEYIKAERERLSLRKFMFANKQAIVYGVVIALASSYLAIQVLIPFFRLSKEIVDLRFERDTLVQSRKETEKQFFLRKIDEQTFRRIVEQKHSQALKVISTINLKKKERKDLVMKRLNPLYVGKLIKDKLSKKKS